MKIFSGILTEINSDYIVIKETKKKNPMSLIFENVSAEGFSEGQKVKLLSENGKLKLKKTFLNII